MFVPFSERTKVTKNQEKNDKSSDDTTQQDNAGTSNDIHKEKKQGKKRK